MVDSLGDRMKEYEACFDMKLPHRLPLLIRLDGRTFHTVTKSLKLAKPMDEPFHRAMVKTALYLGALALSSHTSLAESCEDQIPYILEQTLDKHVSPDLDVEISEVNKTKYGNEFLIGFEQENGWIVFSDDCSTANTSFRFGTKTVELN